MELPFSDPVLIFASVMIIILLAPILARRLKLPEILGLILAGLVFGPYGLGLIERDDTIRLLGQVGLLFIMFLAGLEIDLHQVKRNRSHSLVFGIITFIIPLAVGTGVASWVMAVSLPTAILLSSMYSSHTLLTFPVITKLGLTRSRSVTTTIGGTIITDTLALLVLATIAATVRGDVSPAFWTRLASMIVLYVLATILVLPRLGRWFLRNVASDDTTAFVFVIAVTFFTAYLAHLAGLEPIIGAFLAGLTLNSLIPDKSGLMARLHFTGNALFIPFFLLSVGMLVNLRLLLDGRDAWVVVGVMTATALVTKWVAAVLSGRILGYSGVESRLIYGLSVNQAAATLAAALVGYEIGLFNDAIITGTIVMIGITCFIGPLVTERAGKSLAEARTTRLREEREPPSRILVPVIEKENAAQLMEVAFYLRGEADRHEPVYPVHVVPDGPDAEDQVARGEELLAHMVVRSLAAGVPVNPLTMVDLNIASGILRAITENRISTLILAWDGVQHRTRVFGRVLDVIVAGTTRQILLNRLVSPVNTVRRVRLLVPPRADQEVGFPEAVHTIRKLASQCGMSIVLYADRTFPEASWEFVRKARPNVETSIKRYTVWKEIVQVLREDVTATDSVLLMTARVGSISWQPKSDRLPSLLAGSCPSNNVSVMYVAGERNVEYTSGDEHETDYRPEQVFQPVYTLLNTDHREIETLIRDMVRLIESGSGETWERLVAHMIRIARSEPVELLPEVVLLHTHAPEVDRSTVLLAVSRNEIALPRVETGIHVVIMLLDPVGLDPGDHLAALGRIAGAIRSPGFLKRLRGASGFDDLL